MIFNNAGKFHNIDFNLNGVRLECVSRYKNLGVCFCLSGSFTYTQEDLYNKSLKAYFKFSKEFLSLNQIFILVCMYLIIQLNPYCYMGVKYGVLSIHSPLNLEKVLILLIWNTFTPIIFRKNTYSEFIKKATNLAVLSELGRHPLYFNIVKSMLNYYLRLEKTGSTFPLLNDAYI
jgi:hypothetical protein